MTSFGSSEVSPGFGSMVLSGLALLCWRSSCSDYSSSAHIIQQFLKTMEDSIKCVYLSGNTRHSDVEL